MEGKRGEWTTRGQATTVTMQGGKEKGGSAIIVGKGGLAIIVGKGGSAIIVGKGGLAIIVGKGGSAIIVGKGGSAIIVGGWVGNNSGYISKMHIVCPVLDRSAQRITEPQWSQKGLSLDSA